MKELNRRGFLTMGLGGLAGLAAGEMLPLVNAQQAGLVHAASASIEPIYGTFVLDERVISQVDPQTNQVLQNAFWGIPMEYESLASKLVAPTSANLGELEKWVATRCNETCAEIPAVNLRSDWNAFETLVNVPIYGQPNMSDLIGKTITALVDGASLDLALDFLYDARLEQTRKIHLPLVSSGALQQGAIFAPIESPKPITASGGVAAAPPNITMYGWKLQFRGPETHPLGSCVSQNVNHCHVEIFRQNASGGWNYILNLHLGAYRSDGRRCFVLFNNTRPYVCWKICSPTSSQLTEMLKWALAAAAALAGVVLAAWLISLIASTAAAAVFPALLLL